MPRTKVCKQCGKEFIDKYRDGKIFCSRICYAEWRRGKPGHPGLSGKDNPNWRGGNHRICLHCKKDFIDRGYAKQKFCSKKCAGAYRHERDRVILICQTCGKNFSVLKHEATTRIYCSRYCSTQNLDARRRRGLSHKGKTISESTKQAVSSANSKRAASQSFTSGKSGHHKSIKAGTVYYRSSWEQRAYQLLDKDTNVLTYKTEPFVIKYQNEQGEIRRYRPDILVTFTDETQLLIEVKPQWCLEDPKTQLKLKAGNEWARQHGMPFEIWGAKELRL